MQLVYFVILYSFLFAFKHILEKESINFTKLPKESIAQKKEGSLSLTLSVFKLCPPFLHHQISRTVYRLSILFVSHLSHSPLSSGFHPRLLFTRWPLYSHWNPPQLNECICKVLLLLIPFSFKGLFLASASGKSLFSFPYWLCSVFTGQPTKHSSENNVLNDLPGKPRLLLRHQLRLHTDSNPSLFSSAPFLSSQSPKENFHLHGPEAFQTQHIIDELIHSIDLPPPYP